jgi:hypothetical protein
MTTYRLTVTRFEPLTDEEKKDRDRSLRNFGAMPEVVVDARPTRVIEVELTDKEYEAVKQALVAVWT